MAICIARATGYDKNRVKRISRTGSLSAEAEARTRRTTAKANIFADGGGRISVERDGKILHEIVFRPEDH